VLDAAPGRFDPDVGEAGADLIRATGRDDVPAAVAAALDAVEDGSWPTLAQAIEPDIRHMPRPLRAEAGRDVLAATLGLVIVGTLLDAGWGRASRWVSSVLIPPDGAVVDVRDLAEQAVGSGNADELRALLQLPAGAAPGVAV
jgi:hypothetical protein